MVCTNKNKQEKQVYQTSLAYIRVGVVNCIEMTLSKPLPHLKLLPATVIVLILNEPEVFPGGSSWAFGLRLLPTFAGALREKNCTRASFNKTPTNYIS